MVKNKYNDTFKRLAESTKSKKLLIERFKDKRIEPLQQGELRRIEPVEIIKPPEYRQRILQDTSNANIFNMPWNTGLYIHDVTMSTRATTANTYTITTTAKFHDYQRNVMDLLFEEEEKRKKEQLLREEIRRKKLAIRESWAKRNREATQDKLNSNKSHYSHSPYSIELDLLTAIAENKVLNTKTTEYDPKTGELKLFGIVIVKISTSASKDVCSIYLPTTILDKLNLFRLRLRQLGLHCIAYKKNTRLYLDDKRYVTLEPGKEYTIPVVYRRSCLPTGLMTRVRENESHQLSFKYHRIDPLFETLYFNPGHWAYIEKYGGFDIRLMSYRNSDYVIVKAQYHYGYDQRYGQNTSFLCQDDEIFNYGVRAFLYKIRDHIHQLLNDINTRTIRMREPYRNVFATEPYQNIFTTDPNAIVNPVWDQYDPTDNPWLINTDIARQNDFTIDTGEMHGQD